MKPLVDDLYSNEGTQPQSDIGRVAIGAAAAVLAYQSSLWTLLGHIRLDTRSARLGVVFALAAALAAAQRQAPRQVSIHDRQVDWIVGVPLVLFAGALSASSFGAPASDYWAHRTDLLSLPFFVAGIAALLFGLRTLGRQRHAIVFLFLAWPRPYTFVSRQLLGGARGVDVVTTFVVIGAAVLCMANGHTREKLSWFISGAALVWLTNLALYRLGSVMELLGFLAVTVTTLALLPRFGLTYRYAVEGEWAPRIGPIRPPVRLAAGCVLLAAVAMAWLNVSAS